MTEEDEEIAIRSVLQGDVGSDWDSIPPGRRAAEGEGMIRTAVGGRRREGDDESSTPVGRSIDQYSDPNTPILFPLLSRGEREKVRRRVMWGDDGMLRHVNGTTPPPSPMVCV